MLQLITTYLAGGSNNEMYIIINIEKAGREFQTGNNKHDIINVKDVHEG